MTSAVGPSAPAKLSLEEKLAAFEAETRESAAAARSSVRSEPTQAETAADAGARVLALLYDYIHKRKLKVMDIFKRIDKDGSGTLTLEEFRTACAMLGFEMPETGEAPTDSQLVHAFECLDSDGGAMCRAAHQHLEAPRSATARGYSPACVPAVSASCLSLSLLLAGWLSGRAAGGWGAGGEIEAAEFLDNLMQQKRLFQAGRCTDEQEGRGGIRAPPVVRRKPSPKECAEVRRLFQRVQSAGMELSEAITPQVLNVLSR
jgi:hypothetical protein